jgi:nitroreductase
VAQHAAYYFIRWAHVKEAPVLIVLCGDAKSRIYRQFLHEDIGLAGGQMMLQAHALGLGTCWLGGLDRKAIADVLRVPEGVEVIGILTLGYPAEEPQAPPRKALEQIVHYDVFDNQTAGAEVRAGRLRFGPLGILLRKLRLPFRP